MNPLTRVLLALILISISSCKKKPEEFVFAEKAVFEAEIDGENISLIESDSLINLDSFIIWTPSRLREGRGTGYTIEAWGLSLGRPIVFNNPVADLISINFVNHFYSDQYEENDNIPFELFEEFLSTGEKEFSKNYIEEPGIVIEWNDKNGEKWTTNEVILSGNSISIEIDDTDNYFTVNKSIFLEDRSVEPDYFQFLDLSFDCRLYNASGHSIYLKNGSLKCIYRSFNRSK